MKQIRQGIFETNSSSSHTLVLCKERPIIQNEYEKYESVFGDWWDIEDALINTYDFKEYKDDLKKLKKRLLSKLKCEWEESGKDYNYKHWLEYEYYSELGKMYSFNFCRGKPRVYNDIFHKICFLMAANHYGYDDDKEVQNKINNFLNIVIEKAKSYNKQLGADTTNERRMDLAIKVLLEFHFRDDKFFRDAVYYECSNPINLFDEIIQDEQLIDNFIFNSKSYIALGGDEYECSYVKLVGTMGEYYDKYGSEKYMKEFKKRIEEVYPKDKYIVEIEL